MPVKRGARGGRPRHETIDRLRPTTGRVLGALFSMLGPGGAEGMAVADLYAGTGAFGIAALRKGAERALFIERDRKLCGRIEEALAKGGLSERATVRQGDTIAVLGRVDSKFDLVFADPPYRLNPFEPLLGRLSSRGMLERDAVVYLEHSSRTTLPDTLPGVTMVSRRVYGDSAVSVYRNADLPVGAPERGAQCS